MYSSTYHGNLYKAQVAATYKIAFLSCPHQTFLNRQFAFPELRVLFKRTARSLSLNIFKPLILGKKKHEPSD